MTKEKTPQVPNVSTEFEILTTGRTPKAKVFDEFNPVIEKARHAVAQAALKRSGGKLPNNFVVVGGIIGRSSADNEDYGRIDRYSLLLPKDVNIGDVAIAGGQFYAAEFGIKNPLVVVVGRASDEAIGGMERQFATQQANWRKRQGQQTQSAFVGGKAPGSLPGADEIPAE